MDRQIVYPGAIPLETDLLNTNKYAMMGLAKLAAAMMGSNTYLHGLACTPSSPASMVVNVAKGQIYSLQNVDGTAYSSLAADTTNTILKQGIILGSTAFTLTAPTTAGQSINYLIQVAYGDVDSGATVLPYYNASNPSVAYSGPNNSGTAQNTVRSGVCVVALKAGVAATTGTQTTPAPDTGYTAAWVITVPQGATSITAANIAVAANAPFLPASGVFTAVQQGSMTYAADTGAANAYVASFLPGLPALADGMRVTFKAKTANTGSSTFSVNGGSAFPLYSHAHQALQGGEIIANGLIEVEWNSSLTAWVMCGNSGGATPVATASQSNQAVNMGQIPSLLCGVVGTSRNLAMNVTTASATATITADEIIVETALGGGQYRIASFNKQINLATTGAGGMDTGTVPANGFVGIYAIYNPATGTSALLAVNASAQIGEVYGGSNMPGGYTASALLTIVPIASSQFKPLTVSGRVVNIAASAVLSTSSSLSLSQTSINSIAPLNSKSIDGIISVSSTSAGTLSVSLLTSSGNYGIRQFGGYTPENAAISSSFTSIPISQAGFIYTSTSNATSGTASFVIYCSGYTI
ncbi:phage tail protein [Pantoea ananatis]|uniref:phage tail protein n=1 Tax=Pantoea ananas TaxID=553 RepID=UPI001F4D3F2C|nr:phage tail protein [Pantoea ananatis]MCH9267726.1 phage tail protein [Pantoea ananatis]